MAVGTRTLQGVIAYPVTPFRPGDGGIDTTALEGLVERLVQAGVHGIAPLGSTGESAYLADEEWYEAAQTSLSAVGGRVPTVVGVSDLTTRNAVKRAEFAEAAGADAVMLLPVAYWKLGEREILRHYAAVSDAVSIPVMAYNNPATSGVDMPPELLVRLVTGLENVTMVKESSGDIQRVHRIVQLSEGQVPVFNGSNPLALSAFAAGAVGWCTAAPCLAAEQTLAFYDAVAGGDLAAARSRFYQLLPLLQFIVRGGLPTTVKAGLALQGFETGVPRPPQLPLEQSGRVELQALLSHLARD
ncbi:dihydrodipicolinate synthase family protein [Catenulispora rubra]|uniref:dihydrodipicolinate synthase family protein n=1 Tax=Catenulispora rubra TaxID=280293 RepID=UPI001892611E|nr:dihydrodipicolinate synthase family protein [Catenulispora rubra]